jgi:RNA polymerase sigma-70 factor (ECF subfamily)
MTELYDTYKNRLLKTALSITKNHDMAEDAVQNTFWAAIKHKEKVFAMDEIEFLKWSVTVIKGKCIDLMRREKHYSETSTEDLADILPSDDDPVDVQVVTRDMYDRLMRHVAELDNINRQILQMKYILHFSIKEIADELGFTPTQINSRIARARAKVRKQIESEIDKHGK